MMPLVINTLGGEHTDTHMHTHTHKHTDMRSKAISRNQECMGLWPACAWFKNPFIPIEVLI